jgi:selenocysteine-specific elongation factor
LTAEREQGPLTLGTAGHIDHGKTVLVEALTGTNTDRLPEERARGISIELGFASLELPSGRPLSVVDVPGHERFVRTMVAGATGIDLFLLVVAADDGVMPQTREHVAVLELLGVPAGVVAVTKTDLVGPEGAELAAEEVGELLSSGPYEQTEIVPVCAPGGRGLDRLVEALDRLARGLPTRARTEDGPRLHVDRSFTLHGVGTIVTGTLWSGSIAPGDEVRIEPRGRDARVRSVEVHGRTRERAVAGQRVALNLVGVDRHEVQRGDVIAAATAGLRPTHLVDVALELRPAARPLRRGTRVQVHHGTRETPARIAPVEGDAVESGRRAFAQLRLEQPIVPLAGDRLVIRQIAPPDTIGGGIVVDPAARRHGAGSEHAARLHLLESGDPLERAQARLDAAAGGLEQSDLEPALLERLLASGHARRAGREHARYFAPAKLELARGRLLEVLAGSASAKPLSRGALADAAGVPEQAARAVLEDLLAEGEISARGPGFVLRGGEEDPRAEALMALLEQDSFAPRSVEDAAAGVGIDIDRARATLDGLALEERVVRVKPGLYYHPRAIAEVERRVIEICARAGCVTIATLRDDLETSRKYAQALLEHLDARRVTLRQGDRHILRERAGGARV